MKAKEKKGEFIGNLLGTLAASTVGNMLAGKGFIQDGEGTTRAGQGF